MIPERVPQYLFRGECGAFDTTRAAYDRPDTYYVTGSGPLSKPDLQALLNLVSGLAYRFTQADYGLREHQSIAILQHYGLPTWMIDLTGHLGHAFAFGPARTHLGRLWSSLRQAPRGVQFVLSALAVWTGSDRRHPEVRYAAL